MRVALLIHSTSTAAAGVYEVVRAHALHLEKLGAQVRVFGYRDKDAPDELYPMGGGVSVETTQTLGPQQLGLSFNLPLRICKWKPDIIHTHGIWTGLSLSSYIAARVCRVPLVISPHGMLDQWALRRSKAKKLLAGRLFEKRHLQRADFIHALGAPEAASIRSWGLKNEVVVIPNGIELPNSERPNEPPWPHDGSKTLLFLGRIDKKKGVFQLVEAWNRIQDRVPDWCLRIVGWGTPEMEQQLRSMLDTVPRAQFLGRQEPHQRDACYQHAQGFILPSYSEGLPMTVLEAWSHSLPVLMTSACNLTEAFDQKAAIEIENDVSSLSNQLWTFTNLGSEERLAIGAKGRLLCEEKYQWETIVRNLHDHYLHTIAAHPTR